MDKVINLGIPHVGEKIFRGIDSQGLIGFALVSDTWKVLAESVLLKRWRGRILEACRNGKAEIVKLLLECSENDFDILNRQINDEMVLACKNGHNDVVKLLLTQSDIIIDLNATNSFGKTALMWACQNGHKDVVKLLLEQSERNIDLNAQSDFGWTAFMDACRGGHNDVVKLLLEHSKVDISLPVGFALSKEIKDLIENHHRRNCI